MTTANLCRLLAILFLLGSSQEPRDQPLSKSDAPIYLAVRVSPSRTTIVSGETLNLKVDILNDGARPVYVCKKFDGMGWPLCGVSFELKDSKGSYGPSGTVGGPDFGPDANRAVPLSDVLASDWILLEADHSYGAIIPLNPQTYPQLRKPGIYRVLCAYSSAGVVEGYFGRVKATPAETASLMLKSFSGRVEGNPVVVQVRARGK